MEMPEFITVLTEILAELNDAIANGSPSNDTLVVKATRAVDDCGDQFRVWKAESDVVDRQFFTLTEQIVNTLDTMEEMSRVR